jgi:MFS transporter (putative signal transducer)
MLYAHVSWGLAVSGMAAASVFSTLPTLLQTEPAPPPEAITQSVRTLPSPLAFFGAENASRLLLFGVVLSIAGTIGAAMGRPFLVDAGLSLADIGLFAGILDAAAGLAGALLSGAATARLGARATLIIACLTHAAIKAALSLAAAAHPASPALLGGLVCLDTLGANATYVVVCTLAMNRTRLAQAATDYAVFQSSVGLTTTLTSVACGTLAALIGWTAYFGAGAFLTAMALAIALGLDREARLSRPLESAA